MMTCLLCQQEVKKSFLFSEIFLFSKASLTSCATCQAGFAPISESHCPTCFKAEELSQCQDCLYWKKQKEEVSHESLYCYNDRMADYMSRYKFWGDYLLRYVFADELRVYMKTKSEYTLVPIPISDRRMAERGFNQVTGLLEAARLPFVELLCKDDGQRQSEKTRKERLESQQSFSIKQGRKVPSKILLVDDVYTTGATIHRAKQVLMKNGAKIVKSFSLAR